jgi:hypothetical protein
VGTQTSQLRQLFRTGHNVSIINLSSRRKAALTWHEVYSGLTGAQAFKLVDREVPMLLFSEVTWRCDDRLNMHHISKYREYGRQNCGMKRLLLLGVISMLTVSVAGCMPQANERESEYMGWGRPLISRAAELDCWVTESRNARNVLALELSCASDVSNKQNALIDTAHPAYLAYDLPKELFGKSTGISVLGKSKYYDEYPCGAVVSGLAVESNSLTGICYIQDFEVEWAGTRLNIKKCALRPVDTYKQTPLMPVRIDFQDNWIFTATASPEAIAADYNWLLLPTEFYDTVYHNVYDPESLAGCRAYYIVQLKMNFAFAEDRKY